MKQIEGLVDAALENADSCGRGCSGGSMNGMLTFLVQPDNSLVQIEPEIPLPKFDLQKHLDQLRSNSGAKK
ncbi:MAG: hypothetical protein OEV93_04805 [Candidatus Moranbacteria bacterium]|nr:hypothetical protein [Candidatus Moranbacteria bacterium]